MANANKPAACNYYVPKYVAGKSNGLVKNHNEPVTAGGTEGLYVEEHHEFAQWGFDMHEVTLFGDLFIDASSRFASVAPRNRLPYVNSRNISRFEGYKNSLLVSLGFLPVLTQDAALFTTDLVASEPGLTPAPTELVSSSDYITRFIYLSQDPAERQRTGYNATTLKEQNTTKLRIIGP